MKKWIDYFFCRHEWVYRMSVFYRCKKCDWVKLARTEYGGGTLDYLSRSASL